MLNKRTTDNTAFVRRGGMLSAVALVFNLV